MERSRDPPSSTFFSQNVDLSSLEQRQVVRLMQAAAMTDAVSTASQSLLWTEAQAAFERLADKDTTTALDLLTELVHDPDWQVRKFGGFALEAIALGTQIGEVSTRRLASLLVDLCIDPDDDVQEAVSLVRIEWDDWMTEDLSNEMLSDALSRLQANNQRVATDPHSH